MGSPYAAAQVVSTRGRRGFARLKVSAAGSTRGECRCQREQIAAGELDASGIADYTELLQASMKKRQVGGHFNSRHHRKSGTGRLRNGSI